MNQNVWCPFFIMILICLVAVKLSNSSETSQNRMKDHYKLPDIAKKDVKQQRTQIKFLYSDNKAETNNSIARPIQSEKKYKNIGSIRRKLVQRKFIHIENVLRNDSLDKSQQKIKIIRDKVTNSQKINGEYIYFPNDIYPKALAKKNQIESKNNEIYLDDHKKGAILFEDDFISKNRKDNINEAEINKEFSTPGKDKAQERMIASEQIKEEMENETPQAKKQKETPKQTKEQTKAPEKTKEKIKALEQTKEQAPEKTKEQTKAPEQTKEQTPEQTKAPEQTKEQTKILEKTKEQTKIPEKTLKQTKTLWQTKTQGKSEFAKTIEQKGKEVPNKEENKQADPIPPPKKVTKSRTPIPDPDAADNMMPDRKPNPDDGQGLPYIMLILIFVVIALCIGAGVVVFNKCKSDPNAMNEESIPFKASMQSNPPKHKELEKHGFSML